MQNITCVCIAGVSFQSAHHIEKGLADEQSVVADFFCSWRCLFKSWAKRYDCSGSSLLFPTEKVFSLIYCNPNKCFPWKISSLANK
jgi:hypothetical protein